MLFPCYIHARDIHSMFATSSGLHCDWLMVQSNPFPTLSFIPCFFFSVQFSALYYGASLKKSKQEINLLKLVRRFDFRDFSLSGSKSLS